MSVLAEIVERKRRDVAARMAARPLETFRGDLAPADRDLAAALRRRRTGLILECKAASPSAGPIRPGYDPTAIARSYAPFADAISVLCDQPYFGGDLAHLAAVREAAPCPVLCKDFVVEPYQVYEARHAGADGILLMLSVLDDAGWRACAEACAELGMTPLTEIHDAGELDRALALGAPVVGINNRNLATLAVDLEVTRALAPRIPADRIVVCESGIRDHHDLRSLRHLVDAFLVGTALMREPDLDRAVRALAFGSVKICGLLRPEDAQAAHAAGATFGGLIFASQSRRRVYESEASSLLGSAPLAWVGVSVDDPPAWVARRARALGLAAVQLHGKEDAAYLEALRRELPVGCEIWKAQRVRSLADVEDRPEADRILLDAWHPTEAGGTGQRFDWSGLEARPGRARIVLAGGLSPGNVAEADALGCGALDVNSGVEAGGAGLKHAGRLRELFENLRGPGRRGQETTP